MEIFILEHHTPEDVFYPQVGRLRPVTKNVVQGCASRHISRLRHPIHLKENHHGHE